MNDKLSGLRKIFSLLDKREKQSFSWLMIVTLAAAVLQSVGVAAMLPFMNLVMRPDSIEENRWLTLASKLLGITSHQNMVIAFGVALLISIIVGNIVAAYAIWLKLHFVWGVNHFISSKLFKKYISRPYEYFLNHNSAFLGKNVLDEVVNLTSGYLLPLITIITRGILALAIIGLLLFANFLGTIISFSVIGGAYTLIFGYYKSKLSHAGKKRMECNTARYKAVNEAFGGVKEIKVLGKEDFFLNRFYKYSEEFNLLQAWNATIGQVPRYYMEILAFGGIVAVTIGVLITEGSAQNAIPVISLYAFAIYRLMPAVQEMFQSMTKIQFSVAVLDRVYHDLTGVQDEFHREVLDEKRGDLSQGELTFRNVIELKDISYTYPQSEGKVINGLDLKIAKNTLIAIIGSTGAGKTTLVDILLGLLIPEEGEILVDHSLLDDENRMAWRKNIGYVPQFIYLCDDTVTRNIAFGVPDEEIDHAAVIRATKIANIHMFIKEKLPEGYQTVVGERGVRLSGGQRQRIGIARALYHDPEILIMDEATSSLDGITESAVIDAMENIANMKTLVIIAHRLTTIKNCNTIYLMEGGKITASGDYKTLLQSNQKFRQLAQEHRS